MTSSEIARRILARGAFARGDEADPRVVDTAVLALQRSCTDVTEVLRNSMGDAGCAALLARAFARTERGHPLLKDLRSRSEEGIRLDRMADSAAAHGVENVTAAVEALIAALVDILTRLIGEDMTLRLLDQESPRPARGGGAGEP